MKKKKTKCGAHKKPKMKFLRNPISKQDWEKNWSPILTEFVCEMDAVANCSMDYENIHEMTAFEIYIAGMVKGMFAMIDMVEQRMVREK